MEQPITFNQLNSMPTAGTSRVAPPAFHVMMKPSGSICNLDCEYCYFLSKELMYPGSKFRMADALLEEYTRQYIEAQRVPEVTFAWQGGEPTLMGLDFFRQAIAYQKNYCKPGMRIFNAFQTNGVLLDDDWCAFFKEHDFLIGFDRVMRGLKFLKKHQVEFNVLTTVHAANAGKPLEVYRFLRDEVKTQFMQFIPIVERKNETGFQEGNEVVDRSVTARQYGEFLKTIFDEWVMRDIGSTFVQIFDVALAGYTGNRPGLCVFEETCGTAMAMEHNGDLFTCDHFVEPDYKLGNIQEIPLLDMVASDQQWEFGRDKKESLPQYCLDCEVRFVCNGGCPKNRFIETPDGDPGLNYLCEGYRSFFNHVRRPMEMMATELRARRAPANVMRYLAEEKLQQQQQAFGTVSRNDPCPCGSGRKFKQCHGRKGSH